MEWEKGKASSKRVKHMVTFTPTGNQVPAMVATLLWSGKQGKGFENHYDLLILVTEKNKNKHRHAVICQWNEGPFNNGSGESVMRNDRYHFVL